MTVVFVKENESFENAIRRFKRQVEKDGILSDVKRNRYHEKPSVKKKRKRISAMKRNQKQDRGRR